MKTELNNRLAMLKTSIGILQAPDNKPLWQGQAPKVFSTKVAAAVTAVGGLETLCRQQSVCITGPAEDKLREREALLDIVHPLSAALVVWFEDQNDLANAAKVNFTASVWQHFTGGEVLRQAGVVQDLIAALVSGPQAAPAAEYGLDAAALKEVADGIEAYGGVVTAPQQAISQRKTLTDQLRDEFNRVETAFGHLDRMILRLNKTPEGRTLIGAYQNARVVRSYGIRHDSEEPNPEPPPAPTSTTTPPPAG